MSRNQKLCGVIMVLGLLTGCAATRYERTVTVVRDGQGNITSITEVEHMTQGGSMKKLPTQYVFEKGGTVK